MASVRFDAEGGLNAAGSVNSEVQDISKAIRGRIADPFDKGGKGPQKQRDPYVHLRFSVELNHVSMALFTECSALTIETETFEYPEGGENSFTHKLPTRTKYGNITLKRGLDETQELFNWFLRNIDKRNVSGQMERQNISIVLYDIEGKAVRHWDLKDAYPCKWTGPDMRADSGAVAIETIEFAHGGLIPGNDRASGGGLMSSVINFGSSARGMLDTVLDKVDEGTAFAGDAMDDVKGLDGFA